MKRILFLLMTVFFVTVSNAQDITDGLRYATNTTNGTARFNGLSGAFGALGGDLSAIAINPAGGAVFIQNSVSVSLSTNNLENKASYFNTTTQRDETVATFNQAGVIFVFNTPSETSSWKKFTLGGNYNTTQNYDNTLFVKGIGNTSIAEFFLSQAQGIPLDLLQLQSGESISDLYSFLGQTEGTAAQNAFLGYQGFIFDAVDPQDLANTQYVSNVAAGNFNQEYTYITRGYNSKYTVNFATQYTDRYFFGINLNSHSIDYTRSTILLESNSNAGSIVNRIGFENNLATIGAGFSAQVGGIAKIIPAFRVGITFDTPTWYVISEETTQYLKTQRTDAGESITEIINPHVLNIFEDYDLRTPGKVSASTAYVFGKNGLISFDYAYKDYTQTKFSSSNGGEFSSVNTSIKNNLKGSSSFKLGGEYRIHKFSLRGGVRYEESPYKNETTVEDLKGFSLGLGYNFGNYSFDVSYARAAQNRSQQLYTTGLTDSASIKTTHDNLTFTLGVNL